MEAFLSDVSSHRGVAGYGMSAMAHHEYQSGRCLRAQQRAKVYTLMQRFWHASGQQCKSWLVSQNILQEHCACINADACLT